MIKLVYCITKKPGLTDREFFDYWKNVHGPIGARIPGLRKLVQSHRLTIPGDKHHENDVEITLVDPPARFSFTAYEKGQAFKHEFILTPAPEGTKVERRVDSPEPTGFFRVVYPILWSVVIKPAVQRDLESFKARCEAAT